MITKEWLEKMKKQIQSGSSESTDIRWVFMPKEPGKKTVVRIIDPPNQEGFAEVIYKHYGVPAPTGDKPKSFNCLRNYGMECPICNTIMMYKDISEIRRMRATPRFFFNVLVRRHDEMRQFDPESVYVMVAPQSVFGQIFKYLTEPEYYIPNLLDPNNGYDIVIERLPDNKLSVEATRTPTLLIQDETKIKEIIESVYDLKSFLPKFDESIVKQAEEIANKIKAGVGRLEKGISNTSEITQSKPRLQSNTFTQLQSTTGSTLPECFGKYNPNSVDCLSCPHEISCLKESNK